MTTKQKKNEKCRDSTFTLTTTQFRPIGEVKGGKK